MTHHEAAAAALQAALTAALAPLGIVPVREAELPERCPAAGLVTLRPGDPEEAGRLLGVGVGAPSREYVRAVAVGIVVPGATEAARIARLEAVLETMGGVHGSGIGGAVDWVDFGPPVEADVVPVEGETLLRAVLVDVALHYRTPDNPLAAVS